MGKRKQLGGNKEFDIIIDFVLSTIYPVINIIAGIAFLIFTIIFIGNKNTDFYTKVMSVILITLGILIGIQIIIPVIFHIINIFKNKLQINQNTTNNNSSEINTEFINIIMNFIVIAIKNIGSLSTFVLMIPFFNLIHIYNNSSKSISTNGILNFLLGIFIFLCVYFILINIFVMKNPKTEPNVLAFIGVLGVMLIILNSIFGLISYFISITSDNNLFVTILTITISAIIVILNYILFYFKNEIRELDKYISKIEEKITDEEGKSSWLVNIIYNILDKISLFFN